VLISSFSVDEGFLDQYSIDPIAGRNFSPDIPTDEEGAIILTASAIPFLGIESPQDALGIQLTFNERPVTVVGVVSDFYATGFEDGYQPVALDNRPSNLRFAAVRVAAGNIPSTLAAIEETWQRLAPGLPVTWSFFDEQLNEHYAEWKDSTRILGLFAFLIVVIASLGLLGMAAFTSELRMKEVGIRKVLGADIRQVIGLLSGDYVVLVLIASLIAAPVSYILADRILAMSANHVTLGPLTILAGVLPVLLLALGTIGSQTFRAAAANPAEVIRDE